jgi:hypothetical protein
LQINKGQCGAILALRLRGAKLAHRLLCEEDISIDSIDMTKMQYQFEALLLFTMIE